MAPKILCACPCGQTITPYLARIHLQNYYTSHVPAAPSTPSFPGVDTSGGESDSEPDNDGSLNDLFAPIVDEDPLTDNRPLSPQPPHLPTGCWRVEDVSDDEDESDPEDDPETARQNMLDPEFDFSTFDWDSLDRDLSSLSGMNELSAGYESEVNQIVDRLTTLDHEICRAFSMKLSENLTDKGFEKLKFIPSLNSTSTRLPKLSQVRSRVAFLSGFRPQFFDCCPSSCCAYTGTYTKLKSCPYCDGARYRSDGKARQKFLYMPLIPRLVAFAGNHGMATTMSYRGKHKSSATIISDIFDGAYYRRLCQRHIRIDGKELHSRYFADPRDVALGLSTDGFCPHKRRKKTAWPLIIFNFNLPPDVRFHLENILSLGVIPGPKKPHDIDSFLWPLVDEMQTLANGVHAFDALEPTISKAIFTLRAFLIVVFGDIPAVSMLMNMKGHNGYSPCRMCKITGVRIPDGGRVTTHYVPHDRSTHPSTLADPTAIKVYDLADLPMRTHNEMMQQAQEVLEARTKTAAEKLMKASGIKGISILSTLDSMSFPICFPYDFMHLIWENVMKNMVLLWTGDFKGLDEGAGDYTIEAAVWEAIGKATAESGSTIPSAYGCRVPNIATDRSYMSAEMWSFWTLYIAPVVLRRRFHSAKYYKHFVSLVTLLNLCLEFEISSKDLTTLRSGFVSWVKQYEILYYQHNPARVSACPVTIHGLLHIADSIREMGPVWCYWAFPMERYCGTLSPAIRSRRHPWRSMDRFVLETAQLTQIKVLYNIQEELRLRETPNSRDNVCGAVHIPGYDSCILLPPKPLYPPSKELLNGPISVALATRFNCTVRRVHEHLPQVLAEEYGRVRRIDSTEGDTMYTNHLLKRSEDCRDPTFVRYEMMVDKHAHLRNRRSNFVMQTFYGQLEHIIHLRFPRSAQNTLKAPSDIVLAIIRNWKLEEMNTGLEALDIHIGISEAAIDAIDVTAIQCIIGRVHDRRVWGFIDRSGSLARALPTEDEGFEEE